MCIEHDMLEGVILGYGTVCFVSRDGMAWMMGLGANGKGRSGRGIRELLRWGRRELMWVGYGRSERTG